MKLTPAVRRLLTLAGPSLLILGLYLIVFRLPFIQESKKVQAKYNRLAAKASRIDFQAHFSTLAGLQEESKRLSDVLEPSGHSPSRLVAKPSASGQPMRSHPLAPSPPATNPPATNPPATNPPANNLPATNPPAATLAGLLSLLERHHLQCVATTPMSTGSEKPGDASAVPSDKPAPAPKARSRCQVNIKIKGSYQAMRAALSELKTFSLWLHLITLEMAQVDNTQDRFWSLTVVLQETHR